LATLLRGKLNDYGTGFPGINGLDISRSSSAPPTQRFGLGPGFDSQLASDLRSETDFSNTFVSTSRHDPIVGTSTMYSPGLSWQMWPTTSTGLGGRSDDLKNTADARYRLDKDYDQSAENYSTATSSLLNTRNTDPSLLWRQDLKSPELAKNELHSPLLPRFGLDPARSVASMPSSPLFTAHSTDHMSHIWAPTVSSPAQDFPRSPSPLLGMPHHLSPQQQSHHPLSPGLAPGHTSRSPLSQSSTLRHEASHSPDLDEQLQENGLNSDDLDDRSSQLKSVLNAALDGGDEERLPSLISARSSLFHSKFAPPQRSSSTPPIHGRNFMRNPPPGFSLDQSSKLAEIEFGMQSIQFADPEDDIAIQQANIRRQQYELSQQQWKLQQLQQQRQQHQQMQQMQQKHSLHGSHTPLTAYSPYFENQTMLKDPRLINPQYGFDYNLMTHPGFLAHKEQYAPVQNDFHSIFEGHDEASLGFRANDLAYDPR
ncbi:hypothetical protein BGZ65_008442, partial [Modicella reniformis]